MSLLLLLQAPSEVLAMNTAPTPKCPKHRVFMKFHSGEWPHRFYLCPLCRDHWREHPGSMGKTDLHKAFEAY